MNSICIVDFCGRDSLLCETVDFSADYYPNEKVVKFIGCWAGIPNMPCNHEPTEQSVYNWVKANPNHYEKRRAKALIKHDERNKFFRDMDKHYEEKGYNVIHCIITLSDGSKITALHGCGIYGWQKMLECAKSILNMHTGSKITYFRHYTGIKDVEKFIRKLK